MADTAYCAAFGSFKKLLLCPPEQFCQFGRVQPVTGRKIGLGGGPGESVPRANQLAVVAAIYTIAHQWTKFFRNTAAEFNCEIGNTTSCVDCKGSDNGPGRADIDTFYAGTTMFSSGRVDR